MGTLNSTTMLTLATIVCLFNQTLLIINQNPIVMRRMPARRQPTLEMDHKIFYCVTVGNSSSERRSHEICSVKEMRVFVILS